MNLLRRRIMRKIQYFILNHRGQKQAMLSIRTNILKRFMCILCTVVVFTSCTSVPQVRTSWSQKDGKYAVTIDRDYLEDPAEFKYAVNSFVKERGGSSYNIEKYGPNDFYIEIPGEISVENLPEVRHFHVGRTISAILPPLLATALITIMVAIL
jgi:hypothetical protein